ncbi:hypothetical protein [Rhizobacter sp. LjRoot28]|uniref:hypothetical protein n=1 Tax=Rhizobacter sp. LjRoot28 TaxID=3342309 RepID=UPI003ECF4F43
MLFALLALVIMGLIAATILQSRRVEMKRAAGVAEATVLEKLRNGLQGAMYEHFNALQQGLPMSKGTVSVPVSDESGHRVWRPTVAQLRDMGYLPAGWNAERSALNDGPYSLSLRTVPPGCAAVNCDVEAHVVVMRPFLDEGRGTPVDGVTIGPILTRTGADGGISLATRPGMITGFNNAWTLPNPVPGQPAGIVALRIGTESAGFNQFVRMGDLRDPSLRGDLTAAGSLQIGGGVSVAQGVSVGGDVTVRGTDGQPCVVLRPDGRLSITCAGALAASSATFADGGGNATHVSSSEVATTGEVRADGGVYAGAVSLFSVDHPNSIRLPTNGLSVRGPDGDLMTLSAGGGSIKRTLTVGDMAFENAVEEGAGCETTTAAGGTGRMAVTVDQSLAICIESRWTVAQRWGKAGASCAKPGVFATDQSDGAALICRSGVYTKTAPLLSSFSLAGTRAIQFTDAPVRLAKPDCAEAGTKQVEPLVIIVPNNENPAVQGANTVSGVNRFALDVGDEWELYVERSSDKTILPANIVAFVYCYYPES